MATTTGLFAPTVRERFPAPVRNSQENGKPFLGGRVSQYGTEKVESLLKGRNVVSTPTPLGWIEAHRGWQVYMKREDCLDPNGYGHKIRKVQHVFACARDRGVTDVVLDGCITSNCCACAATYGERFGLRVNLVLRATPPLTVTGNHALMCFAGAQIEFIGPHGDAVEVKRRRAITIRERGGRPLILPPSMSTTEALGAGVDLALEIRAFEQQQGIDFQVIFLPVGTGGSLLGLTIGRTLLKASWRLVGVCIDDLSPNAYSEWFIGEYRRAQLEGFGSLPDVPLLPEVFWPRWHRGYGIPARAAEEEAARIELRHGISLDSTYLAKCWTGAMEWLGERPSSGAALVIHTGGRPAEIDTMSFDELNAEVGK